MGTFTLFLRPFRLFLAHLCHFCIHRASEKEQNLHARMTGKFDMKAEYGEQGRGGGN